VTANDCPKTENKSKKSQNTHKKRKKYKEDVVKKEGRWRQNGNNKLK
jgi:hypothetical protein